MNKVTLVDLYKDVFRRSTLVAIPRINELLEVPGSAFTKWEIFYSIVRDALKTFEYYYPLTLLQKIWIEIDSASRKGVITGNFKGYLDGAVAEDQIVIVPAAIVGMSTSYYTSSTYPYRDFRYNPPEITDCWYSSNTYWVNSICKRPFFEEYDKVTGVPTDRCAVYYLNVDVDNQYSIFRDELFLTTCRYIMNLKKNFLLTNVPVEIFQGLEEDYNTLKSSQDTIYQQALTHSYWLI